MQTMQTSERENEKTKEGIGEDARFLSVRGRGSHNAKAASSGTQTHKPGRVQK